MDSFYLLSRQDSLSLEVKLANINKAIALSKEEKIDSLELKYLSYKTAIYNNHKHLELAMQSADSLRVEALMKKDSVYLAKAYYKLGFYHEKSLNYEMAYENYYESLLISSLMKDSINSADALHKMADLKYQFGDYYGSERLSVTALNYLKDFKALRLKYKLTVLLGITSNNQSDFETAETWYNKALELAENTKDSSNVYNSKGVLAMKKESFESAVENFNHAIELLQASENSSKKTELMIKDNLAFAKGKLGYKNAIEDILKLKEQKNELLDIVGCYASDLHLVQLYKSRNDLERAIHYSKEAFGYADLANSSAAKLEALGYLISFNAIDKEQMGLYKKLTDSVKDSWANYKNVFAKIEYQTEEKEKENLKLKADNTEQALKMQRINTQKWLFAIGSLLLVLISVYVWKRYQTEAKAKRTISMQKEKIELQKKQVETLQRELHHRMKNNLAFIDTFIHLAKSKFPNEAYQIKLNELQNRIQSMFETHKLLVKKDDMTSIDAKSYLDVLIHNVQQSYNRPLVMVVNSTLEGESLSSRLSLPIGLIINEFVTNSYKHAFDESENGRIFISLISTESNLTLVLRDNGKGLPKGFNLDVLESFGMETIRLLVQEYRGTFELDSSNGLFITITLPKNQTDET